MIKQKTRKCLKSKKRNQKNNTFIIANLLLISEIKTFMELCKKTNLELIYNFYIAEMDTFFHIFYFRIIIRHFRITNEIHTFSNV